MSIESSSNVLYRAIAGPMSLTTGVGALFTLLAIMAAQQDYPFELAFTLLAMSVLSSVLGVAAFFVGTTRVILLQDALATGLIIPFVLTVGRWSSGDDGPKMMLVGGVGPWLLIGAGLAIVSIGLVLRRVINQDVESINSSQPQSPPSANPPASDGLA